MSRQVGSGHLAHSLGETGRDEAIFQDNRSTTITINVEAHPVGETESKVTFFCPRRRLLTGFVLSTQMSNVSVEPFYDAEFSEEFH